uniref:NB-ARC domain-containing protein n=1 Tax=Leersia perrieri TaxID=77586 RepID=A0A0D9WYD3_9ORYZ
MEILNTIDTVAVKINELITKDKELELKAKSRLDTIKSNLTLLQGIIEVLELGGEPGGVVATWITQLQELAYDMEDDIDLMASKKKTKAPMHLDRALRILGIRDQRSKYVLKTDSYESRLKDLLTNFENFMKSPTSAPTPAGLAGPNDEANDAAAGASSTALDIPPVGIEYPKKDLLDLLRHVDGQPKQLRVISIVGFRGVGKTTLAKAVYKESDSIGESFDYQAWVQVASRPVAARDEDDMSSMYKKNAASLLKETLRQLRLQANEDNINSPNNDVDSLIYGRYLIVVDNVLFSQVWEYMENAFPKEGSSRIMVTTSVQSVANACSSGGFVYKLRGLNEEDSKKLLCQVVGCEQDKLPGNLKKESDNIVRKCDGLPLALVGVAKYLRHQLRVKSSADYSRKISRNFGMYLARRSDDALRAAQMALAECYEGLNSHNLKTCLLSVSMFPNSHGFSRKSLVRRWMAERLVKADGGTDTSESFEQLVDRIMILQHDAADDELDKDKCRVHGVLHDFLLDKCATKSFARLIHNGVPLGALGSDDSLRRLAVVDDGAGTAAHREQDNKLVERVSDDRLSRVRLLTAVGTQLSGFKFKRCKVLRVLDIDGCTGVNDSVLRSICKLKVLRYLSLRGSDARCLPPEIAELRCLETLDVRGIEAVVFTVTWDILRLPCLKYLFGAFELPRDLPPTCSSWTWTKASKAPADAAAQLHLHTFAGFFVGNGGTTRVDDRERQCLQALIGHMKQLKKLKIWWRRTSSTGLTVADPKAPAPATAVLAELLRRRCFNGLESLSLDFGDQSLDFLDFAVESACKVSSIKLRGKLTSSLPGFIAGNNIASHSILKLHLSFTGLSCEALSVLQELSFLQYLKLVEDSSVFTNGTFKVEANRFQALVMLHIQAPKLPKVIIGGGAIHQLTILKLICGDVSGFQATDIARFQNLDQVVLLKNSLDMDSTQAWEEARKKHRNRPNLDLLETTSFTDQ